MQVRQSSSSIFKHYIFQDTQSQDDYKLPLYKVKSQMWQQCRKTKAGQSSSLIVITALPVFFPFLKQNTNIYTCVSLVSNTLPPVDKEMPKLHNGDQVWRHTVLSLNMENRKRASSSSSLKDSLFPVKVEKHAWIEINVGNKAINKKGCVPTCTKTSRLPIIPDW